MLHVIKQSYASAKREQRLNRIALLSGIVLATGLAILATIMGCFVEILKRESNINKDF